MKKLLILFFICSILSADIEGIKIYNLPFLEENNSNEVNNTIQTNKIIPIKPKLDIAVLINKKLFKKYLPSLINSLNAYLLYKNAEYNLSVYDISEKKEAFKHKNILYYTYDRNFTIENNTSNIYFPILNKNDINITNSNVYFGGIDYFSQIKKLKSFIDENKSIVINDNTLTSKKLFKLEQKLFQTIPFNYNNINYNLLNNSYIFLNTKPKTSAKILSNIYYQNINPNLILSTQINYTPILISLSQNEALNKLIVANSIINIPLDLEDINMLLNSDIKFNAVNYAANILLNKIYNLQSDGDNYFMNDFNIYIYNNQINYNTKLYQIVFRAFKEIYLIP